MWRVAETHGGRQTRQITVTQAVASRAIASAERIKVSWFKYAGFGLGPQNRGRTV